MPVICRDAICDCHILVKAGMITIGAGEQDFYPG